eukprot:6583418-Karenia_brevis.AAC.1
MCHEMHNEYLTELNTYMDDKMNVSAKNAWSRWFVCTVIPSVERQAFLVSSRKKKFIEYKWTAARVANDAGVHVPDVSNNP